MKGASNMQRQIPTASYDASVHISDYALVNTLEDSALVGNWFVFLKTDWLKRSGMDRLLATSGIVDVTPKPAILFRGKEEIALPGATIAPSLLPRPDLISLTCDKALYRVNRDTVRLLIAALQHSSIGQQTREMTLQLRLNGQPYADYPLALDEYGLCLWSMQGLPEGSYEAVIQSKEATTQGEPSPVILSEAKDLAGPCRFEIAEYRLAPLNAELVEQQLNGETLRYTLAVTSFGQPYTGPIEVELQERGQRIGKSEQLTCNREGRCRGAVILNKAKDLGAGPYTLNVFAGERTATVALKGSEQERRETLIISELGEMRELSLLPLPQSNQCRGMYIARGGNNTQPFLVRRVVGSEVEITPRVEAELLRVVVVDPTRGTIEETLYEHLAAEKSIRLPIPTPYGIVLLGAFADGKAWEGWCAVLRPSDLQLQCEAPKEARPGARIKLTLKTANTDRVVPVHLIVKDARLIALSDPQVELASCVKKNLSAWREQSRTGEIDRQLAHFAQNPWARAGGAVRPAFATPLPPGMPRPMLAANGGQTLIARAMPHITDAMPLATQPLQAPAGISAMSATTNVGNATTSLPIGNPAASPGERQAAVALSSPTSLLANIRLQFPEIIYNNIVKVQGEASVEIILGDSMTRYSIEAFALSPDALDWQRVESSIEAVQPVYGELTVSSFVFPGDPVMGRLDVGAASGGAIVEVRHDDDILPLFFDDGNAVTPGLPIPSGSAVRFPVRPGAITSTVRDARKGGIDVSERYVTEPGKLRHIMRCLRLLTPGSEVTVLEPDVLEIKPLPGLERPFQFFVESASQYAFGCIEQTSTKVLAMYTGYITNQDNAKIARDYEGAILVWYKRLKSMYLPNGGFCMYPPEEGGARKPDTHYAPLGVKHLLNLLTAVGTGVEKGALGGLAPVHYGESKAMRELLDDIHTMATSAARYYNIDYPPREISDCHAAYQVLVSGASQKDKDTALAFVRSHLTEHNGQTYVGTQFIAPLAHKLYGMEVSTRQETAYAAAALLVAGDPADLPKAIAATNYLTGHLNEEGRLYSTVDTAACLALMIGLRKANVVTTANAGRVHLNGQEMRLADALSYDGKVETLRAVEGIIAAQVTSQVNEDWRALKSQLSVEVYLERKGRKQQRFKVGDALDLVISVPRYEPGLIAHVCLPDALARIVGGAQVKRFSLDFCERSVLRVPLAAISSTSFPKYKDGETETNVLRWLGIGSKESSAGNVQHWAVIVRNMFKEEQVGNPGLLEVMVE